MKNLKNLVLLVIFIIGSVTSTYAEGHPEAYFGIYGIQHYSSVEAYQQYVGKVVKYIPSSHRKGSYDDNKYWLGAGGKYNAEYVITKIKGNNRRMTFVLNEKGTQNKVKMVVNNQEELKSNGKYTYCITNSYSIPLFLSEKFEADKANIIGTKFPSKPGSPSQIEVTDIVLQPVEWTVSNYNRCYPVVYYILTDKNDGQKSYYYPEKEDGLKAIGTVFTNPKFSCSYTVINVEYKEEEGFFFNDRKYYTVKNSIDGHTKEVEAAHADFYAFKGDDSGKFVAALSKVEKPETSTVRYGYSTSVSDKDITKYSYIDNLIDILIFAGSTEFYITLTNVSDNTLKVIWNDAVFVDVDGRTSKIMHSGIKYSQKEAEQPSSSIIKDAKLEESLMPTDNVYYDDILKKWTSKTLYDRANQNAEG